MKIYIAGPMTGYPDFNYPAFHAAEEFLRDLGLWLHAAILNPARHFDGDTGLLRETYIQRALNAIATADWVVLLPQWMSSNGVHQELNSVRGGPLLLRYQPGEGAHRRLTALGWHDPGLVAWLDGPAPKVPGTEPPVSESVRRKARPLCTGVLDYFPDALLAVAHCSKVGNDQHNPGEPLRWAKEKSQDEADALLRHLIDRGTMDSDGVRHSAKVAWRALALLQRELDKEKT